MSDDQTSSVTAPAPYHVSKSNICVDSKGESNGNGVFANRRFGAGEEVASFKRPLVGSLETERLLDTCANCYMWTEGSSTGTRLYVPEGVKVDKCAACARFRYCSKACQKAAWNRGHKHECKVLKPMAGRGLPKAFLACIELLTRRKHGLISDQDWEMVMSNALTIITPTLDPLGIILDPTLCSLNHSCDPNAFIMMDSPSVSIRTLRPIRKDKEIFISYIDTTYPYHKRQEELQTRWFFTCRCAKCQEKATLQEDNWLLPVDSKFVLDAEAKKAMAQTQEQTFAVYEELHKLSTEHVIYGLKQILASCYESRFYPIYRQPYAEARDVLIVNLLSMGKFQDAWAQCAKRYKYILPKLYPVPFHPVRVVQTWQMAMLAAYLASTEEGVGAPGVNMGLIAMMLVKQVLDVAHLSHGPNNAFTKSVKGKAEEMIEELKRSVGNPDNAVMNRELEVQRDRLMEMGDWAEDGKISKPLKQVKLVEEAFSV
ncbi:set and mynd domain [Pyrenophora tritici-repentis]|nr:set and mynd domain [Pyrenophora tritici-repentis]KAI0612679.1 set and mynd domain [Pyrenophora tritici-repentis]KAI0620420.1 set and mynd domain [Pyrenophora tritici-repentis]